MSTSADNSRPLKIALVYLIAAVFCAIFGAVYELFSYEVYSYFMLYAFAFPLCGGTLPYLIYSLFSGLIIPSRFDRLLGHAGIATLTTGSIISGVLEIYGTTNLLTGIYWFTGSLLCLCFVFRIFGCFIRGDADSRISAEQSVNR